MSNRAHNTTFVGSASYAINPALKHISAGWVDRELLTVRKMAAAGATAVEIGEAIGKSAVTARNIIRRNNLSWSQKSDDRHLYKSAQTIGSYMDRGAYDWHDKALELRRAGASQADICKATGLNQSVVSKFLRGHGLGRISLANDARATRHADTRAAKARDCGWLPISTAPKDGTEFDVWAVNDEGQSRRICEVSWGPVCDWAGNEWDDWRGMRPSLYHAKFEPTHWMPLPSPPVAS